MIRRTPVMKQPGIFPMENKGDLCDTDLPWRVNPRRPETFPLGVFLGGTRKMLRKQNTKQTLVATQIFFFVVGSNHQLAGVFWPFTSQEKTKTSKRTRSLSVPFIESFLGWTRGRCSPLQLVGTRWFAQWHLQRHVTWPGLRRIFEFFLQVQRGNNQKGDDDTYLLTACWNRNVSLEESLERTGVFKTFFGEEQQNTVDFKTAPWLTWQRWLKWQLLTRKSIKSSWFWSV